MHEAETIVAADRWHLDVADMTPGTRVDGVYAILNPQVSASRSGKPFLKCIIRDASGRVNARMWSIDDPILETLGRAAFVAVSGSCENFNDQIQLKIERIEPAEVDAEELRRLLPTSRRDPEAMLADVRTLMGTISHPAVKGLIDAYLGDSSFVTRFTQAPAAISVHHAYLGGLIEHTLQLLTAANVILPQYPDLDRDIVLAGLLLHDSGKVLEFDLERFEYTRRGNLLGHLMDGVVMMETYAAKAQLAGSPVLPADAKLAIQHIIASHHNRPEFGAIKQPATPEAIFCSRLDDLDAATQIAIEAADRSSVTGDFTEQIHALDGVRIYRRPPLAD